MKTNLKSAFCLMLGATFLFLSCERDEATLEEETNLEIIEIENDIINDYDPGREPVTNQRIISMVQALELDARSLTKGDFHLPDGTVEERIYIGNDIAITVETLMQMEVPTGDESDDINTRQYRTNNLVTGANRTIDILGFTGGSQRLSGRARNGLRDAVRNYNNLSGHNLRFRLTFGSSQNAINNADMVVFDDTVNQGGSGGSAGFPSNGRPNKFIEIHGLASFSRNVHEHVITHEIGHSVGFRHTDWFNRISCGQNTNEGQAGVGAVHISGTPTGNDATSLMNACFSSGANGEFNANDRRALRRIY